MDGLAACSTSRPSRSRLTSRPAAKPDDPMAPGPGTRPARRTTMPCGWAADLVQRCAVQALCKPQIMLRETGGGAALLSDDGDLDKISQQQSRSHVCSGIQGSDTKWGPPGSTIHAPVQYCTVRSAHCQDQASIDLSLSFCVCHSVALFSLCLHFSSRASTRPAPACPHTHTHTHSLTQLRTRAREIRSLVRPEAYKLTSQTYSCTHVPSTMAGMYRTLPVCVPHAAC